MEQEEETIDINVDYVKHYQKHVARVAAHLNGVDYSQEPSRSSYFPPCGYWSAADKDRFFHALTIRSRLRPDLIAAEIPGKTVVDVCVYLDLLEEASAKEPKKWDRSAFPATVEVSDKWVEYEKEQASAMAAMEPVWEADHREDRRESAFRAERRAMRKHRGERPGGIRDREDEKRRTAILKNFQAKQEAGWEKEDYTRELGRAQLKAIDSILREAEEVSTDVSADAQETSQSSLLETIEKETIVPDSVIDPVLLGQLDPSPALVDPSDKGGYDLGCQRAALPPPILPNLEDTLSPNLDVTSLNNPTEATVDLGNLSPKSRRRHQKRLYMRRKRAEQSGREIAAVAMRLKPGRKTNKKLAREMLRKKSRVIEEDENMDVDDELDLRDAPFTISNQEGDEKEEVVDVHGGKEEMEISLANGAAVIAGASASPITDGLEEQVASLHPHIGGLTPPYKIKKEFLDFGYDAASLESEGLGLFHLSRFADLMKLYTSLQLSESDIASYVSAPLIKLLHAEIVSFVNDVMHRAIALHEQEWLSKKHTKVWRLREQQIKAPSIHQALETLNAAKDKKDIFSSLTSRSTDFVPQSVKRSITAKQRKQKADRGMDENAEACEGDSANGSEEPGEDDDENAGMDEDADTSDREEQETIREALPVLPLHREICTPFIWHESLDHLDPDPYRISDALTVTDEGIDNALDNLDDSALVDELVEEEELDAMDLVASKQAEAELWTKFGPQRESFETGEEVVKEAIVEECVAIPELAEVNVGRRGNMALKLKKASGRIKSNVYVEDSD